HWCRCRDRRRRPAGPLRGPRPGPRRARASAGGLPTGGLTSRLPDVQRWRGVEQVPGAWGRCVVTIGVFDGVHRGHQLIIERAVEKAQELGVPSVVLTFDPHPMEVVRPGSHPPLLTGPRYKADLVEDLGVDVFCVL